MPTNYVFKFTDPLKTNFSVFPFTTNGPVSPTDGTLIPQAVTARTTLKLYGKDAANFGEGIEQNLIYMMEHFANPTRPVNNIEGQIWYATNTGSPPTTELFIRNSNIDDNTGGPGWTGIILSTGTTAMAGELILSGPPVSLLGATTKQYVDLAVAASGGVSPEAGLFLDGLTLTGAPPLLLSSEVNYLIGVNQNVQAQIDSRVSKAGDTMDASATLIFDAGALNMTNAANIVFTGGGLITGLPLTPGSPTEAASKSYVDLVVSGIGGGDGVFTSVAWLPAGSPPAIVTPSETVLEFTIIHPSLPPTTIMAEGVSRVGHGHEAVDVSLDTTFNVSYPTNIQAAIQFIDIAKAPLTNASFTGTLNSAGPLIVNGPSAFTNNVIGITPTLPPHLSTKKYVDDAIVNRATNRVHRNFEVLGGIHTSPTPYQVQSHLADDNLLSITINGLKQYAHVYGKQEILYDPATGSIDPSTFTGLDDSLTYYFDIDVDGGGIQTVTLLPGTPISTHGDLITAINNELTAGVFTIPTTDHEDFVSDTSGAGSSVAITDPAGANVYLFDIDPAPTVINSANFLSLPRTATNTPDDIVIVGDVSAQFPVEQPFTIRGSNDAIYGSFDGTYRVHVNGPVVTSSPVSTIIPIAWIGDATLNEPLLNAYQPVASPFPPLPAPVAFGDAHLTPIVGFDQIATAVAGVDADYAETDIAGVTIVPTEQTDYVVFTLDIPATNQIETLLLN